MQGATNFFEQQDAARRQTGRLVVLFVLALIAIVVSIDLLVAALVAYASREHELQPIDWTQGLNPVVLGGASLAALLLVGGGSLYKIATLWGGGRVVAESLGGRRVRPDTTDDRERRLLNVVEEMAIASGTPTPPVYLMEVEDGINAFAAGHGLDDAVIGVTRGTLERLSRDELQGVIAHEFSHILNGDMRLNLRLMGLLHGILLVGLLGHFVLRMSFYAGLTRRRGRSSNPVPLVALGAGLMAVGFLGTFFGSLIKAAVSRQREYLADASAVQFTRNPNGLGGALKKIGGSYRQAALATPAAAEASHLFFGQAVSGITSLFSTHPPLAERIHRLDPTWDGRFVESPRPPRSAAPPARTSTMSGHAATSGLAEAVADVGQPRDAHLAYATELIGLVPAALVAQAHDPYSARALVYALLLDRGDLRRRQLEALAATGEADAATLADQLAVPVARLDARARLPLVELTLPALDALTETQYRRFRRNVEGLVASDGQLQLFEWVLQRLVLRHLDAQHLPVPRPGRPRPLETLVAPAAVTLSTLAWVGHPSETSAARAFDLGWAATGLPSTHLLPPEACGFDRLGEALTALDQAEPAGKRRLLDGVSTCISADLTVTVNEAELLRAVAASISCPMPPLLPSSSV